MVKIADHEIQDDNPITSITVKYADGTEAIVTKNAVIARIKDDEENSDDMTISIEFCEMPVDAVASIAWLMFKAASE